MQVESLSIPDVKLIHPNRHGDARGFFQQTYVTADYIAHGIPGPFVQDNWSRSARGTLRGLHYQLNHAQAKLVHVVRGQVFDVVVDIRRGSPTFGRWLGCTLSEDDPAQLYVPRGCAHGFLVLSETADFLYKCDDYYTPGDEYSVRWDDPDIGIAWPSTDAHPRLSAKDQAAPLLADVPESQLLVWPSAG